MSYYDEIDTYQCDRFYQEVNEWNEDIDVSPWRIDPHFHRQHSYNFNQAPPREHPVDLTPLDFYLMGGPETCPPYYSSPPTLYDSSSSSSSRPSPPVDSPASSFLRTPELYHRDVLISSLGINPYTFEPDYDMQASESCVAMQNVQKCADAQFEESIDDFVIYETAYEPQELVPSTRDEGGSPSSTTYYHHHHHHYHQIPIANVGTNQTTTGPYPKIEPKPEPKPTPATRHSHRNRRAVAEHALQSQGKQHNQPETKLSNKKKRKKTTTKMTTMANPSPNPNPLSDLSPAHYPPTAAPHPSPPRTNGNATQQPSTSAWDSGDAIYAHPKPNPSTAIRVTTPKNPPPTISTAKTSSSSTCDECTRTASHYPPRRRL
jgi:hypothetical protein